MRRCRAHGSGSPSTGVARLSGLDTRRRQPVIFAPYLPHGGCGVGTRRPVQTSVFVEVEPRARRGDFFACCPHAPGARVLGLAVATRPGSGTDRWRHRQASYRPSTEIPYNRTIVQIRMHPASTRGSGDNMPAAKQLPKVLQNLALPVISSPMFIVSYPELVLAQCKAGIVGSFPALNARPAELLDEWLAQMQEDLAGYRAANPGAQVGPIAVNQIVHNSNIRLEQDVRVCVEHKVPIFITSLRAPVKEMIDAVHSYGGIVLHDVINLRHAEKAIEAGVDGLILVAAGAGGHAGTLSPFALCGEVRRIFDGPIALSGSIATGDAVLAAQAMGADFAYVGTRFIGSQEAHANESYKRSITEAAAADIVYTNLFTGVHGTYIRE